jgi:23S rRNA (cytosine1962-C5)-methyltransferase
VTLRAVPVVRLAPGKEKSLLRRHPWVFSGAIAEEPQRAGFGETVILVSSSGEFLARASWSPESQIRARVWTFDENESVDDDFFRRRIAAAIDARRGLVATGADAQSTGTISSSQPGGRVTGNALRLVHGESDGLPGLIVDRYGDVLVCQFLATGVEHWQGVLLEALAESTGATTIYERSDADVREKEGLPTRCGLRQGKEPPGLVEIEENGRRYLVDVREGHKTGFYLDQRLGRDAAARWCRGRDVLNAFSYTGGFSVAVLAGGAASVVDVDTSGPSLELARRNVEANSPGGGGHAAGRYDAIEGDVFTLLRRFRDSRRTFDAIVLDPPKFADARAHLDKAARGYKDINLLAFKLLRPGGILLTFSCSGLMTGELFQKIVADAAVDARRDAAVVERLAQPPDHPVALPFPEGAYLKGLVCRVR